MNSNILVALYFALFMLPHVHAEATRQVSLGPGQNLSVGNQQSGAANQYSSAMGDLTHTVVRDLRARHTPVSHWDASPSLGVFPLGNKTGILFVNGARFDLRECDDVTRLKAAVSANRHRDITRVPLPGGYLHLYPEHVEEIARGASCGFLDRARKSLGR